MLKIPNKYVDQMVAHSLKENPNECCGILSGADGVIQCLYRITNTANSPYRYLMDPQVKATLSYLIMASMKLPNLCLQWMEMVFIILKMDFVLIQPYRITGMWIRLRFVD